MIYTQRIEALQAEIERLGGQQEEPWVDGWCFRLGPSVLHLPGDAAQDRDWGWFSASDMATFVNAPVASGLNIRTTTESITWPGTRANSTLRNSNGCGINCFDHTKALHMGLSGCRVLPNPVVFII